MKTARSVMSSVPTATRLSSPVKPDLYQKPFLVRSALSMGYAAKCAEYSISPDGKLRRYTKACLSVGLLIGVPAVLILPAVLTAALLLLGIAQALFTAALYVGGLIVIVMIVSAMTVKKGGRW